VTRKSPPLAWVDERAQFPPVEQAMAEPNGLLAASLALTPQMVENAYRRGIFPWYGENQPVLWWSPNPRMVLVPDEFKCSRSLAKTIRKWSRDPAVSIRLNHAFDRVMQACAAPRDAEGGTWITSPVIAAYGALHRRGIAHSVETWIDGRLVGGLYGVGIGAMFYGESMFARVPDASKVALAHLVAFLQRAGGRLIDCQQNTRHLASLGGHEIARRDFCERLVELIQQPGPDWSAGVLRDDGSKEPRPERGSTKR
jgi:leucyl/phenylalanyl-tRNA--protein transferase